MRREWLSVWASLFLGITFLIAGLAKFTEYPGIFEPVLLSGFLEYINISGAIPYIEIIIGVLLILLVAVRWTLFVASLMILGFIVNNIILINMGMASEPCNCFGGLTSGGLSVTGALMVDGVMVGIALIVFLYYPGRFFNMRPWYLMNVTDVKGVASNE